MKARSALRSLLVALILVLGSVSVGLPASADEGKSDESRSSSSEKDKSDKDKSDDDDKDDSDDEESESDDGEDSDDARGSDDGDSPDQGDNDESNDEKSKDEKDKDEKPRNDKPKSNKPKDDKSKDDKSKDDKPRNDEPKNDKPKNDKPKNDKPKNDKPNPPATKDPICHRTHSEKHPYVSISPSAKGVANGHAGHEQDTTFLDGGCQLANLPLSPTELSEQRLAAALVVVAAAPNVTICHSTNSATNPYVANSPAAQGVINGHAGHDGPVFQTGATGWGDIIPPFSNINGVSFAGQNWTAAGQAIYNNGCAPVTPAAPPTPPVLAGEDAPLCHAVGDHFVRLSVAANATASGHAAHFRDIIPPFTFGPNDSLSFAGLNWDDEGQDIFNDGCERDDSDDSDDSDGSDDSDDSDSAEAGLPYTGGLPRLALLIGGLLTGLGLVVRQATAQPRR